MWVVISGSPFREGKCSTLAGKIADMLCDQSEVEVEQFNVSELHVHGCIGCNECQSDGICIYDDDMTDLRHVLDQADGAIVVSPIYFAGVPSQLKALLDRFQPYFWRRQDLLNAGTPLPYKRPLISILIGEGNDPFGSDPAFASISSAFALADFAPTLKRTYIAQDEDEIFESLGNDIERIIDSSKDPILPIPINLDSVTVSSSAIQDSNISNQNEDL